jgi:hypothetical protein
MLVSAIRRRILRDVRVALCIHAVFLFVLLSCFAADWQLGAPLLVTLFLPHWITLYIVSAPAGDSLTGLISIMGIVGFLMSLPISLIYAAAWNSLLFFIRLLRDRFYSTTVRFGDTSYD